MTAHELPDGSGREHTDGRRRRGAVRRARLIEAALAVVARDGAGALTHGRVADEAGLARSAVSHHFASLDDLLDAALRSNSDALVAALPGLGEGAGLTWLAEELVGFFTAHRERVVAGYELYLLAAHRPTLDGAVAQWLDLLEATARQHSSEPHRVTAAVAAIDGYFLQCLARRADPEREVLLALLEDILQCRT